MTILTAILGTVVGLIFLFNTTVAMGLVYDTEDFFYHMEDKELENDLKPTIINRINDLGKLRVLVEISMFGIFAVFYYIWLSIEE